MDAHTVGPTPTQAHAYLGSGNVFHTFRFNPDQVQWGYVENAVNRDTIGGRVVQVLSIQISGITVSGRAGSRGELQRLADNIRDIMSYHIRTSRPVSFKVPSRNWNFLVYVEAMPQIGWDVAATSYPYQLQLVVEDDLTGVKAREIQVGAIARLAEGIGYNEAFHGGNAKKFEEFVSEIASSTFGTVSQSVDVANGELPAANDAVAQRVLEAAQSQEGVGYDWATANPLGPEGGEGAGFDCSGFTLWCYKEAGVTGLPHLAQGQMDYCKSKGWFFGPSDFGQFAPGDLIFFTSTSGGCKRGDNSWVQVCHVGLYWDGNGTDGKMIDSHSSTDPIRVRNISEYGAQYVVGGGRPR